MSNKLKLIVKGVTERYDGIQSITEFVLNPTNANMYGAYDEEHIISLMETISKDGLVEPIVLYPDGKTIKSGHNRFMACVRLGHTELPYVLSNEDKPDSLLSEMISLSIANMGRPANIGRSYTSVLKMIDAFISEHDGFEPNASEIKMYCSYHQITYDSFCKIKKIQSQAPDLFSKVIDSKMSISAAFKELNTRAKCVVKLTRTPFMNGLVGVTDINYALGVVTNVLDQIKTIQILKPDGEVQNAFEDFQKNTIGGIIHELFTNAIKESVNHSKNENVLIAPKNHNLYDLQSIKYNSGIETKTCVTEIGKKPKWVTHRYKDGYVLLLSITPNANRVIAGYGIVPSNCWKIGTTIGSIDLDKLIDANTMNWLIGSVEKDNGKIVANHDKIEI